MFKLLNRALQLMAMPKKIFLIIALGHLVYALLHSDHLYIAIPGTLFFTLLVFRKT